MSHTKVSFYTEFLVTLCLSLKIYYYPPIFLFPLDTFKMLLTIQKELFCVKTAEKTFLFQKLLFSMWNAANGSNCILKTMLFFTDRDDFEDFSNNQHFFIQFEIDGSLSNCHPKEIDDSFISSRANLKWKGPNVTKRKINCLV